MLDPVLRPLKDRVLLAVARPLGMHVSPGAVTAAALLLGLVCAALLLVPSPGWALAAWLGSRTLDGLDGIVARAHGRQSDLGGYLDILCDFVVYAAVPIALVAGRPPTPGAWLALSVLLASFYVNAASWMYLAAILEKRSAGAHMRGESTSVAMPGGVIGGSETVVLFAVFILLPELLVPLFLLMAALVAVTVVQRLAWAARHL